MELMVLLAQDVVVLLKLAVPRTADRNLTYAKLGDELFMSPSQVFRSIERAEGARLLTTPDVSPHSPEKLPHKWLRQYHGANLKEFLVHGVKYAFPAKRSGLTRGIPTAEAAPPLVQHFPQDSSFPPVWPHVEGLSRGLAFFPLSENVPQAATLDDKLYELLALLDAIREGRAREREIAIRELTARIDGAGQVKANSV
jgi:hypothetical protein